MAARWKQKDAESFTAGIGDDKYMLEAPGEKKKAVKSHLWQLEQSWTFPLLRTQFSKVFSFVSVLNSLGNRKKEFGSPKHLMTHRSRIIFRSVQHHLRMRPNIRQQGFKLQNS